MTTPEDDMDLTPATADESALLDDLRVVIGRQAPKADLLVGSRIGSYGILELLGEGGMARVYRASDSDTGRVVALKVLKPEYQSSEDIGRRFAQEAQTMTRIHHTHVARVYATPEDGAVRAIAMELLTGGSLRDLLIRGVHKKKRLRVNAVVRFALQATQGLAAAHEVGVVHRDIKPGNLMLDRAGRVKVVDFGVVLALERATWLTGVGRPIGTPAYMSPEQCRGERVCPASDVYAMGVTIFEMLTGRLPFRDEGGSPFALMLKHIQEPAPDPRRLRDVIPEWLADVVLRCLAKNPDERYADAGALVKALTDRRTTERAVTVTAAASPAARIDVTAIREQLQRLPQRAIVAWACRCARYVQRYNGDPRLERSLTMAEMYVHGGERQPEGKTLSQALTRVKQLRNASFRAAYSEGGIEETPSSAQAALAAAAASACAAARCAADAAADAAYVAQRSCAALEYAGVPLTEFWRQAQSDYRVLLARKIGVEGTVGEPLPPSFWSETRPT